MSEYILIDVSKHDEEWREKIRNFLLQNGLIVPRGVVTTSGASEFKVVYE